MKQKLLDMIAELEKEIIIFDNKNRKKFEELHASHKNRMEALRVYLVGKGMSPEWKITRIEDDWKLHLHFKVEPIPCIGRVALSRKGITSAILEDDIIRREVSMKKQKQIYRLFSDGISFLIPLILECWIKKYVSLIFVRKIQLEFKEESPMSCIAD